MECTNSFANPVSSSMYLSARRLPLTSKYSPIVSGSRAAGERDLIFTSTLFSNSWSSSGLRSATGRPSLSREQSNPALEALEQLGPEKRLKDLKRSALATAVDGHNGANKEHKAIEFRSPPNHEFLSFRRVVAFAGEDLQVVLGRFHFDFAEFSVLGRIGRIVAQRILAAELLGNLVKGFRELLFRPNGNHAPAGLLRQFVRYSRVAAISRVHDEQDMNHRIRALRRFDRFFQSYLAARVLRVGNDDNCLAPGFRSEFFTARQVDRVI